MLYQMGTSKCQKHLVCTQPSRTNYGLNYESWTWCLLFTMHSIKGLRRPVDSCTILCGQQRLGQCSSLPWPLAGSSLPLWNTMNIIKLGKSYRVIDGPSCTAAGAGTHQRYPVRNCSWKHHQVITMSYTKKINYQKSSKLKAFSYLYI